jgi:hypothetical protein
LRMVILRLDRVSATCFGLTCTNARYAVEATLRCDIGRICPRDELDDVGEASNEYGRLMLLLKEEMPEGSWMCWRHGLHPAWLLPGHPHLMFAWHQIWVPGWTRSGEESDFCMMEICPRDWLQYVYKDICWQNNAARDNDPNADKPLPKLRHDLSIKSIVGEWMHPPVTLDRGHRGHAFLVKRRYTPSTPSYMTW